MSSNYEPQIRYYHTYTDDFVESKNQHFRLPENYIWIRKGLFYRITSKCLYGLAVVFAFFYCKFGLHVKIENGTILKKYKKSGYFLYGNHTQPVGDAFIPAMVLFPKRCYVLASPANMGIPVLGSLLPLLGALPLPDKLGDMKKLKQALSQRISEKKCVVVYPEAHVWPWHTGIRPLPSSSFAFPVELKVPAFCMTTTYRKRKHGKKPGIVIYIDGPFYADSTLTKKEQKNKLRDTVQECMVQRSKNSTYQYIRYEKEKS